MIKLWRENAGVRVFARTVAVAVIMYVFDVYRGENEYLGLTPFLVGLGGAVVFAIAGLLGLEPFVGIKPKVEVPPNAEVTP